MRKKIYMMASISEKDDADAAEQMREGRTQCVTDALTRVMNRRYGRTTQLSFYQWHDYDGEVDP